VPRQKHQLRQANGERLWQLWEASDEARQIKIRQKLDFFRLSMAIQWFKYDLWMGQRNPASPWMVETL
jgi:hypothetical protein